MSGMVRPESGQGQEVTIVAQPCWTADELRAQIRAWEEALHAQGYSQSTVWTYLRGGQTFVQWLAGEAQAGSSAESA